MKEACALLLAAILSASASAAPSRLSLYVNRAPTAAETAALDTKSKFEPPAGCYLGAYIDLDSSIKGTTKDGTGREHKSPEEFEEQTARIHSTYFFYQGYGSRMPYDWIKRLGASGKIVHIALEPNNGLQFVKDDDYLTSLAVQLSHTKTPIFLRFASEMNGKWLAWNGNPELYKEKFRLVTKIMRKYAPNVAMVWCPYAMPVTNIPSYYPGDDSVDWVGVNIYNVTYLDQKLSTPGTHIGPTELLDYVYNRYSKTKPIFIGEYGVTHFSRVENRSVPDFAKRCLSSLYWGLPRQYPRVKAISYFCGNNLENEQVRNNNYAVTQNMEVLYTYQRIIKQSWFLSSPITEHAPVALLTSDVGRAKGDLLPYPWQMRPMPIKDSEPIENGNVVSAWCDVHEPGYQFVLLLNGVKIAESPDISRIEATIQSSQFKSGKNELKFQVWKGRRLQSEIARSIKPVL